MRRPRGLNLEPLEMRALMAGDLIAHWVANDLNGGTDDGAAISAWNDTLNGISATASGTPILAKGELSGHSLVRFDASDGSDFFRIIGRDSPLSEATDFSLSVTFVTHSSDLVGGTGPWYEATGLADANRLNLGRGTGLTINQAGQIGGGLGGAFGAPASSVYSGSTGLNDGQLHTATLTRSGSTLSVYVDNGAANTITDADALARESNLEMLIGAAAPGKNPFTGGIAEVRVYNGQLSAAEVATLHQELDGFYNNAAPTASDDTYNLNEDPLFGFVSINAAQGVLTNDTDGEGDSLTASLVTPPEKIQVTLNADGSFNLILPTDFFGTDTFTYTANDSQPSDPATVTINVANVYDPATAVNDRYKLRPTDTLNVSALDGVLANDLNPDQATLAAVLKTDVNQGALTLGADGSVLFDPQGQAGFVTFTYQVNDQTQLSAAATVTLVVNTPPVAASDTLTVNEDVSLKRTAADGVLANDTDADGDALTVSLIEGPQHGNLTLGADGSIDYLPNPDYFGADRFTYQVTDGEDSSNIATVNLNIQAVNDPPVAVEDAYFTNTDKPLTIGTAAGVLANDSDVDSVNLTAVIQQSPSSGTLQLAVDGGFTYTPNAGFTGTDSFTYRAADGQGQSAPTTVSLLVGEPPVMINEFMAANATTLETAVRQDPADRFDREKSTPDWLELVNLTTADLDISGFHLTDEADEPMKWQIPAGTVLPAGGYLVVFADRLNITNPELDEAGLMHTNFKLDVTGEYLAVTSRTGSVIHQYERYPEQRGDISYGLTPDGTPGHLLAPTPGAANVGAYTGLVPDTAVSVPRGFYDTSFTVALSNPDPNAVIRYTTDGSEPTLAKGDVYSTPLTITGTTVLKAAAFRENYVPSPVVAQSYIFPAQVLLQDDTGLEGALRWGHAGPDWAMDPVIVNNADPELRPVVDDFLRIPTVSLSIDTDLFFGQSDAGRGIYIAGENIERPVAFEFFDPATPGASVQTNSTIQIVGGSSPQRWKSDKLSMRVRFTEDTGESELEFPVFGPDAASAFDTLVIDARLNNVWHYGGGSDPDGQRGRAQYMRDEFAADLQNAVGGYATHAQHVHVYINGLYWGMHILHERPDENFGATYMGGIAEEYNVIKHTAGEVVSGSNASFLELNGLLGRDRDPPLDDQTYAAASEMLDIDNFINYMLVNFYGGNADWDHHNWYATQSPVDGKWRFHSWDAEKVLENVSGNVTTTNNANAPTGMNRRLMTHPEYQLRFADLVQKHFFHDGAMTPEATAKLYAERSDQIDLVMRVESARWGDNQIDQGRRVRYTRADWVENRQGLYDDYFPRRTEVVLRQFDRLGWFQSDQAPEFSVNGTPQHGGAVTPSSRLTMAAPEGTIFFTTDGSDPRLAGGDLAPGAQTYTAPLTVNAELTLTARMRRTDGTWGPVSEARFTTGVAADASSLRISELHYHPADATAAEEAAGFTDADEFEFIELVNISNVPIDLDQVRFQQNVGADGVEGIGFVFADGSVRELAPGGRAVVVENLEAFRLRYGDQLPVAGEWNGGLSNAGERIVLMAGEQMIADFRYDDGWHPTTDGRGPSLQAVDEAGDPAAWGTAAAWRASALSGGSPGRSEGPLPGDSNRDGIFNSSDLVLVFAAGKYEDNLPNNATFEEGDWNGDGDFTTADLVFAFTAGTYVNAATPRPLFDLGAAPDLGLTNLMGQSENEVSFADQARLSANDLDQIFADLGDEDETSRGWPLA